MSETPWETLTSEQKIERLHHELERFLQHDRENLVLRNARYEELKDRVAELEKVLKRMESQSQPE